MDGFYWVVLKVERNFQMHPSVESLKMERNTCQFRGGGWNLGSGPRPVNIQDADTVLSSRTGPLGRLDRP